ncbi:hypothetical protein BALOs_1153 [Halobacteriovorax sp. BALOs_7]|nr:hypothetical protein BALOs_1153 [Halobacteriovorax sp. BALOs_7]
MKNKFNKMSDFNNFCILKLWFIFSSWSNNNRFDKNEVTYKLLK